MPRRFVLPTRIQHSDPVRVRHVLSRGEPAANNVCCRNVSKLYRWHDSKRLHIMPRRKRLRGGLIIAHGLLTWHHRGHLEPGLVYRLFGGYVSRRAGPDGMQSVHAWLLLLRAKC